MHIFIYIYEFFFFIYLNDIYVQFRSLSERSSLATTRTCSWGRRWPWGSTSRSLVWRWELWLRWWWWWWWWWWGGWGGAGRSLKIQLSNYCFGTLTRGALEDWILHLYKPLLAGVFFTKLIVAWHTDFNDGVVLIQKLIWYITLTIDTSNTKIQQWKSWTLPGSRNLI